MTASSSSNSGRSRWSHIVLLALAIVFAAATVLYTWFWTVAVRIEQPPAVELGLDFPYQPSQRAFVVTNVRPGSPAERAGIVAGDQVVAFDGRRVENQTDQERVWQRHVPGDSVGLTIVQIGRASCRERV